MYKGLKWDIDKMIEAGKNIQHDPGLEKYRGVSLFPKKVAKANELLKNVKLPTIPKEEQK